MDEVDRMEEKTKQSLTVQAAVKVGDAARQQSQGLSLHLPQGKVNSTQATLVNEDH